MGKLLLKGIYGILEGQEYYIYQGQSVIIGRSRSCDIYLEVPKNLNYTSEEEKKSFLNHFKTISRKHLRIDYYREDKIEIEDLSVNGTWVDGEMIKKIEINDITTKEYVLLLGTREKFILEWVP